MRLTILQTVLLTIAILAVVFVAIGVWQHNIMMQRMMGMMAFQPAWWIGPIVMLLITAILTLLVIYLVFYRVSETRKENVYEINTSVIKILTEDERRVVEYIINNGGEALQKDVAKALGLSRLKTHRIVSSLKKRGVVEVEPWGNTNRIKLLNRT